MFIGYLSGYIYLLPFQPRQEILTTATKVGEAAKEIVDRVDPLSIEYQDGLVVLAKGVANATASLVRKVCGKIQRTTHFTVLPSIRATC